MFPSRSKTVLRFLKRISGGITMARAQFRQAHIDIKIMNVSPCLAAFGKCE